MSKLRFTFDADALRVMTFGGNRPRQPENPVIDEALRLDSGLALLDHLWAKNDLSERAAMKLAIEAQHAARPPRN